MRIIFKISNRVYFENNEKRISSLRAMVQSTSITYTQPLKPMKLNESFT